MVGFSVAQDRPPVLVIPEDTSSAKSVKAPQSEGDQKATLGVSVVKPSAALYAQLPDLPAGCGFLLQTVTSGGAASDAGLMPMDVIWKLNEQILINESQMMVLLSHAKPGDKLKVSFFRSGIAKHVEVVLHGANSKVRHPDVLAMAPPLPVLPMRVISYEDRSASISDKTGTATLTYREGKLWLHVESEKGVEVFNNFVTEPSQIAAIPTVWRNRLPVLQRSLEESIRLRKLPRVRHVPRMPKKERIVGGTAGE